MKNRRIESRKASVVHQKQPFIEHAYELKRRIFIIAACVFIAGAGIYSVQQHIVALLLKPAHGQNFIYTSPGGGIDFLFKVCIYGGLIICTPIIVYNFLAFLSPLLQHSSRRFIFTISIVSTLLAVVGVIFGYSVGLPAALHFLLHQFKTVQIKPLVTIQSYLSFVMAYIMGSALLFQLPIFLISINRIKPLKPSKLLHYERWVILAAFVLAGLMNPTPNLVSQLLVAGPFILMYQVGIAIIAFVNRSKYPVEVSQLFEKDVLNQSQRLEIAKLAKPIAPVDLKTELTKVFNPAVSPAVSTTKTAGPKMLIPSPIAVSPVINQRSFNSSQVSDARSAIYDSLNRSRNSRRSYIDFVPTIGN
jgi:sec-independent protein translocase protein TatC